jgi:hypothetical protein
MGLLRAKRARGVPFVAEVPVKRGTPMKRTAFNREGPALHREAKPAISVDEWLRTLPPSESYQTWRPTPIFQRGTAR